MKTGRPGSLFLSVLLLVSLATPLLISSSVDTVGAQTAPGAWVAVSNSPTIKGYAVGVVGAGKNIYIANSSTGQSRYFMRYNTLADGWEYLATPPAPVKNAVAMAWDRGNYIYVLNGASYSTDAFFFYRYDIGGNSWARLQDTPHTQGAGDAMCWVPGSALGVSDDYLYAIVGKRGSGSKFYRYSVKDSSWSSELNLLWGTTDDGCSLVWTGGSYLYALRGEWNETSPCYDFARYDLINNSWTSMAPIPASPHDGASGGVGDGGSLLWIGGDFGDYIYALSGNQAYPENPPVYDKRFYRYTISANSWERLADLPAGVGDQNGPRLGFASGTSKIYCWRGCKGDPVLWMYRLASRGVDVSISPSYQENAPGGTLEYEVTVTNKGNVLDTYDLMADDNEGWDLSIASSITVPVGESRTTTLTVTIPENAISCTEDNVTVTAISQADDTVEKGASCTAHVPIVRGVYVSISPGYKENVPSGTLEYTVTVTNKGNVMDAYDLMADDNEGWGLSIASSILVPAFENRTTTLIMTIPDNAVPCTRDNVIVTAISQADDTVENSASCTAHAVPIVRGVEVSISPSYQENAPGGTLEYEMTVTNTGNVPDNYDLSASDNEGWDLILDNGSLSIPVSESRTTALTVAIPENAMPCTEDNITVTATSQADPSVSDNASCLAHAVQLGVEVSISPISQETLPGGKLEYTVVVKNTGMVLDSYALKVSDNQGWTLGLADNLLIVPPENTKLEFLPLADTVVDGQDSPDIPRGESTGLDVTETKDATLLKFDVSSIDSSIEDVALKLYCYRITYEESRKVDLWGVEDDWEENVTWNSGRPAAETGVLVDDVLEDILSWWTFQSALLTEYVEKQRQGDGIVSFALDYGGAYLYAHISSIHYGQNYYSKEADENHPYLEIFLPGETTLTVAIPENAVPCTRDNITVTATSQTNNTVENSASCIAHAIVRGVDVSISPDYQENVPGWTLEYEVTVTNTGNVSDTYDLRAGDNEGWGPTLGVGSLTVPPFGENRTATLTVTIPDNATGCTRDNITATATSQTDNTVENSASCTAHAVPIIRGVEVSISPSYQEKLPGGTLEYTVTVTNTGNVPDTYDLTVSDTENWRLTISPTSLALAPGASDSAVLSVIIPDNASISTRVTVTATSRENAEVSDSDTCTAHAIPIVHGVDISISPDYQENAPGGTLEYEVTVTNTGNAQDTYDLSASDNEGWGLILDNGSLSIPVSESRKTALTVAIPEDAVPCTVDNILVTATCRADNTKAENSCIGHVIPFVHGVEVSISPEGQEGRPGASVKFTVTVKNTGNILDNYNLTPSDDTSWVLKLDDDYLEIPVNENRETKLTVSIPDNESLVCITDNITVVATAVGNVEVTDNDTVTVHAMPPWAGTAMFKLKNLYAVGLEKDLQLYAGSKFVVKFYKYDNTTLQGESVIDEFALPHHAEDTGSIPHPLGLPVEMVTLVLTTYNTEDVLSTITSFAVTRDDLFGRIGAIKGIWPFASPDERNALFAEISSIKGQWPVAPRGG